MRRTDIHPSPDLPPARAGRPFRAGSPSPPPIGNAVPSKVRGGVKFRVANRHEGRRERNEKEKRERERMVVRPVRARLRYPPFR